MSIVKTYDVFCDAPDETGARCPAWTFGTTAKTGHSGSASNDARKRARRDGWTRREGHDLCPLHKDYRP